MNPEEQRISHDDPQLDPRGVERSPISDAELAEWQREDREEVERAAAVEEALNAQTRRIVELEESWMELAERATGQVAQARALEGELSRLREVADKARASRRAASAELSRAERRAVNAQARVEELEKESGVRIIEFEDKLTKQRGLAVRSERIAAEHEEQLADLRRTVKDLKEQLAVEAHERSEAEAVAAERDRISRDLERALSELDLEKEHFADARRRLEHELDAAREASSRLQAEVAQVADERAKATKLAERQAIEKRALVADLVATQATLQARSEQLQNILRSRWHRVARSAWKARRRRPPIVALFLSLLAVAGTVVGVLTAQDLGAMIASVLGGAIIGSVAVAYAVVVPALRDQRIPRMAGDGTFARPLDVAEAGPDAAPKPETAPAPKAEEPAGVRLVPLPSPDAEVDLERARWLSGGRTAPLRELKVAAILDEMSQACFGPECRLDTGFGANDWEERLSASPPHMLLVESAWSGNGGGWQYCVASYQHPRYAGLPFLRELLAWCGERGIPTVFWNKEDPVHFDRFKEAAALFDHVFTSDANRIEAYAALDGAHCKTVEALPFAAQPRLHNPIPVTEERLREPVFAGTYYRDRHADRRRSLEAILDAGRPHGLVIYDRTHGSTSDAYGFPERFAPHIRGRLSYDEIVTEYKRHLVFLNVNSVADSPTMFSRRVFELLACGTAVLSTPSVGMQETFGDLVPVAETEEEASAALQRLLDDHEYRDGLTRRAQRLVLSEHTYRDRLAQIAKAAGFAISDNDGERTAALAIARNREELNRVCDAVLRQTRLPDEVLVGCDDGASLDGGVERVRERLPDGRVRVVRQQPHDSPPQRLRELASLATTEWVAPLRPEARYGPDHLKGLLACTRFADAQVVGAGGLERTMGYVAAVSPDAAVAARDLVARRGWPQDVDEMRRWFAEGTRIYAADPHEPEGG